MVLVCRGLCPQHQAMRSPFRRTLTSFAAAGLIVPATLFVPLPAQAAPASVVTHTVVVGTSPRAIAITPDGRTALVANSSSSNVSMIDVSTGTVTNTVTVGPNPTDIKISPDGATAYIAVYGTFGDTSTSAVHWLDIATASITRTLRTAGGGLGSYPSSLVVSPNGQDIYVYPTAPVTPWVARVRASDGAVFTPVYTAFAGSPFGSSIQEVVISPDGQRLAVIPQLDSAAADIVDTNTMNRTQTVALSIANGRATYSADGTELFVSDAANDQIAVINTTSYNVTRWSSGGDGPRGLVAARSGTVFVSNQTSNGLASLRSSALTGTVDVTDPQQPVLTEDQDRVLVVSTSSNALAVISASALTRELVAVGASPTNVATARGYAVVSNNASNSVSIIRLAEVPASGDQVPTAPLQQFGRSESQDCSTTTIPDSVLLPGVGEDQRRDGWGMSWAQWPNGGTGGFVCTRQPYFTNTGRWSVG